MIFKSRTTVLAVASSGGHWQQLLLATEELRGSDIVFATTKRELLDQAGLQGFLVSDSNRSSPLRLCRTVWDCMNMVFRLRPKVVISTGAAPGLLCLVFGSLIGARTIWIDSFANVEKLSMSGKIAGYVASEWLTQWEHLSSTRGPTYIGELL